MAQVNVIGRITADLELKTSEKSNPYVRFDIAENIGSRQTLHTQYFQVCAWGEDANRLMKAHAKKGSLIWVTGSLELEPYTKRDGISIDKRMKILLDTVPLKVMDALDRLAGKKIFLFVTCGIEPSEEYKRLIERKIEPFLPDECDYCGILLCRGQIAEEVLSKIQRQFAQQPDDPAIKKMISEAKLSEGHPDETDAENAVRFIREKLDSF